MDHDVGGVGHGVELLLDHDGFVLSGINNDGRRLAKYK